MKLCGLHLMYDWTVVALCHGCHSVRPVPTAYYT